MNRKNLPETRTHFKTAKYLFNISVRSNKFKMLIFIVLFLSGNSINCRAQGVWANLTNLAPNQNQGDMLLLSDGTVLVKTSAVDGDTLGNLWNKLTPDIHGSYINGTWSTIAPMFNTRLYFSSQVLTDGRVYAAGGEYGSGGQSGETYDPLTNTWTMAPALPVGGEAILDGNSEILPDGKVLQAIVTGGALATAIYDPVANTYIAGPSSIGCHDESAWVKLPDSSILFVDMGTNNSERYIPSLGAWVADAGVPVSLYDLYGFEAGPGFLLPDGRAFFIGSPSVTAYYTPSGSASPGTWAAGPAIPGGQGAPDAPGAMMPNGKILCVLSPAPDSANHFPSPASIYEFNYLTNTFTNIAVPGGGDTMAGPSYITHMLDLPDGSVLFSIIGDKQYYDYIPGGTPLAAGKPVIDSIIQVSCTTFKATGKLFNGITEGAAYGDDWQMATNYPIISLTSGTHVYFARSYNWNRTGVMTGSQPDTTFFDLPSGLPDGAYWLRVIANGNPSDSVLFKTCGAEMASNVPLPSGIAEAYPNPVKGMLTFEYYAINNGVYALKLVDILGRSVFEENGNFTQGKNRQQLDLSDIMPGIYSLVIMDNDGVYKKKIIVE